MILVHGIVTEIKRAQRKQYRAYGRFQAGGVFLYKVHKPRAGQKQQNGQFEYERWNMVPRGALS